MIDKEERRIPCAHCSNARAARACPHCGRMVCGACDDGTLGACPLPRPRTLALPAGGRAVDADPEGARLLYEKPGGWGHLALTAAGGVAAVVRKAPPPRSELPLMCALDRGRVAWALRKRHYFNLLQKLEVHVHEPWGINGHYRRALASNHDFWLFGQGGDVVVLWGHKVEVFEGGSGANTVTFELPRFMSCGSIRQGHRPIIALGAGRLVVLYSINIHLRSNPPLPPVSEVGSLVLPAEVVWLRLVDAALVLIVRAGPSGAVALAVPYEGGPAPEAAVSLTPRHMVPCSVNTPLQASASRDARLIVLATPTPGQIVALDMTSGDQQVVTACAAPLDLVKLVDDDRQLVTGSSAGEVVVWQVRKRRLVTHEAAGEPASKRDDPSRR